MEDLIEKWIVVQRQWARECAEECDSAEIMHLYTVNILSGILLGIEPPAQDPSGRSLTSRLREVE
jgi:hypothetical protein